MDLALFDSHGTPTREAIGRALKREGQQRAAEHAGPSWASEILGALRLWCAPRRGQHIVIEDFRQQVPLSLQPRSAKAWGAVPRLAVAAGLIQPTDRYVAARSPRTHAHMVRQWLVL